MNNQPVLNQPIMPPTSTGANELPQRSTDKKRTIILLGIVLFIGILFGVGSYVAVQQITKKPEEPKVTTIVVTPTPSPTPIRYQTNISTTSAFISMEEAISSFSQKLIDFSKDDPSLNPPNLVLPLGL